MNRQSMASGGDSNDFYAVGISFAIGDGSAIDLVEARKNYRAAAELGHPEGAFNYAAMLISGEGGTRSKKEAMRWMRLASSLGSGDASIWLAEHAVSVGRTQVAVKCFSIAALQGDSRGLRGIADLLLDSGNIEIVRHVLARHGEAGTRGNP